MRIEPDDLTSAAVVAFLEAHVAQLRATSPPGSSHALDLAGLRARDVSFWSAYDGGDLVGCVALKRLTGPPDGHAELKSMRTAPDRLGQGIGARLLTFALEQARDAGFTRVSLETGSQDFFAPAHRLYARHDFVACEPFAGYRPDPSSRFMTRTL
ncbi:GNAT family N-acetyltransferase [Nocardioides plantarum]|uniref:GNAT family N-acetyltransferase n=1 Tax=Nocardioides plantarum TaxID=29299 RepID=A0ABV5KDM1_9ACTN|nr:GNAT family N-acetyltransferase [Nocardioides plantarum]